MEASLSQSLAHMDKFLSNVINTRKEELMSWQKNSNPHDDDLLSRFMKKK
ncbi:hypothetical protein LguiA_010396 [Lonicera macranthoides]